MNWKSIFDQVVDKFSPQFIEGWILFVLASAYIHFKVHYQHGDEIARGLKGENGMWEAPEVVIYIWMYLWPPVIMANLFLGITLGDQEWDFMKTILWSVFGFKSVSEGIKAWKEKSQTPPSAPKQPMP